MAKPTNIQRAFLAGVRHGYRLDRKETKRDVEDLVEELKDTHAEVCAELARRQAPTTTARPSATLKRG
jgi:hypothetical protein